MNSTMKRLRAFKQTKWTQSIKQSNAANDKEMKFFFWEHKSMKCSSFHQLLNAKDISLISFSMALCTLKRILRDSNTEQKEVKSLNDKHNKREKSLLNPSNCDLWLG